MNITLSTQVTFRKPQVEDGAAIWRLVRESGGLDWNSAYAYLMMCDMFPSTCAVACVDGRLVGFAIGYRKPEQPDTLFIWQIGVDVSYRGNAIGRRLLQKLLRRKENADIRCLEATVGPNNAASRGLFLRLAADYETACIVTEHYAPSLFPEGETHDAELLYRVGPLTMKKGVIE
ncbi:L-2,4-diaminobutyric acid acetyltransferase [Paenibacillus phyllosphaerae]|uniref:L-2,4-diaminobutyric acid acetyltransferase n=1 Tax=Paenibacillus phyllosphaerae TaxID=274593 RepID=A0A7W5B3D4_9BACL|nr:diaminobutyrate acetyltransferase [Paenibacillus phyllosphaerae]MBB3113424.1 L-2,4-diaminobutyric acid acetyltransferase [Paenibacillus phyllosphaerae]